MLPRGREKRLPPLLRACLAEAVARFSFGGWLCLNGNISDLLQATETRCPTALAIRARVPYQSASSASASMPTVLKEPTDPQFHRREPEFSYHRRRS